MEAGSRAYGESHELEAAAASSANWRLRLQKPDWAQVLKFSCFTLRAGMNRQHSAVESRNRVMGVHRGAECRRKVAMAIGSSSCEQLRSRAAFGVNSSATPTEGTPGVPQLGGLGTDD